MAASSTTKEQRLQLISECRNSGMSDIRWCTEHGIDPGTFYNWVKRFRREGVYDIPSRTTADRYEPEPRHEVVEISAPAFRQVSAIEDSVEPEHAGNIAMSLSFCGINIQITNSAKPELLATLIGTLRGAV